MHHALRMIDAINKVVGIILGAMLAIMSITIVVQVIARFIPGLSFSWSEELSRYLMIYSVFFGAALAMRLQKLVAVEVLPEMLKGNKRRVLKTIIMVICIVFFALLLKHGIDMVTNVVNQKTPAMQISMSIPYLSIPIGATLLIINSIAVIIELYANEEEGQA